MTASATRNGSTDNDNGLTPLARGLKNDREEDSRSCPHECHGSLSLTDNDIVICQSCRCTPDGVYIPPKGGDTGAIEGRCSQYGWYYPWGKRLEGRDEDRRRYHHSNRVVLPGGFEDVYDEDDDNRPNGVSDEYTWDLSTL